ncbi:MAG: RNA methyltransferase [Muribaculaceae bacterium]|nr:RNA methyltransferase [Muribaculaceae bacterium]
MSKKLVTFDLGMLYNTLSKTKARELKMLSTKKERDKTGLFLAEGEKCVVDTLGAFDLQYLIATSQWLDNHEKITSAYSQNILSTDKRGLEIVSSLGSVPEVIAVFKKNDFSHFSPTFKADKLYLLLDEIQDPGNLGTIIRTCDWFGVYDIFASKNTVDVYSPKVVQATMGSLSRVRVHYVDLASLIKNNREMPLIGTLLEGEPYKKYKPGGGLLLMGNEGRGISEELKALINVALTIPAANSNSHPDSLNVSVATAILLAHLSPT